MVFASLILFRTLKEDAFRVRIFLLANATQGEG
jgi:hypothetical protein